MLNAKYCCGEKPLVTYTSRELSIDGPDLPAFYEIICPVCGHKIRVEDTSMIIGGVAYNKALRLWNESIDKRNAG